MNIALRPLMKHFGAEVLNVDSPVDLPDDDFGQIVDLLNRYSVLLFRGLSLTPADQAALAHRFGRPKIETRKQFNMSEYPEVSTIGNTRDENGKPTAFFNRDSFSWHTDGTAACHVNAATFLYAVQTPAAGGDTLYCSTAFACDTLPPELKAEIQDAEMLCSFHAHNDRILEQDPDAFVPLTHVERDALPPVWHRLVQTHPVTGRRVLYLNLDPLDFKGIDPARGREVMLQLVDHATREAYVYRHRWQNGDLVIWDDHATMHGPTEIAPYEHDTRLLHRSFVYMLPTERPLPNLEEVNAIFSR